MIAGFSFLHQTPSEHNKKHISGDLFGDLVYLRPTRSPNETKTIDFIGSPSAIELQEINANR